MKNFKAILERNRKKARRSARKRRRSEVLSFVESLEAKLLMASIAGASECSIVMDLENTITNASTVETALKAAKVFLIKHPELSSILQVNRSDVAGNYANDFKLTIWW